MCYNYTNHSHAKWLKSNNPFFLSKISLQVAETLKGVNASLALKYRSQGEGVSTELTTAPKQSDI